MTVASLCRWPQGNTLHRQHGCLAQSLRLSRPAEERRRDRRHHLRQEHVPGASALTAAELRVLPMLATHLSFPEIAAELFLSPHTIKSQAVSLYRKLGASSQSQGVVRAREPGMLVG
jgi:DNA-binding CsgD family transcriptional regulator